MFPLSLTTNQVVEDNATSTVAPHPSVVTQESAMRSASAQSTETHAARSKTPLTSQIETLNTDSGASVEMVQAMARAKQADTATAQESIAETPIVSLATDSSVRKITPIRNSNALLVIRDNSIQLFS